MPKFILKKPIDSSHVIVIDDPEGDGMLVIPLFINGVTSYFTCQNTTRSEYEDGDLPRIGFSVEAPDRYPSYQDYARLEEMKMGFNGAVFN